VAIGLLTFPNPVNEYAARSEAGTVVVLVAAMSVVRCEWLKSGSASLDPGRGDGYRRRAGHVLDIRLAAARAGGLRCQ